MTIETETTAEHDASPGAKIVVITTGGTIACTTDRDGVLLPTVSGPELLEPVAQRFDNAQLALEVRELNRLDSAAMTLADTDAIIAAIHDALDDPEVTGVVVTHGTDSMEETAIAVDTFHDDPRPVIFTGAQRSFDHPESDGISNLFESIVIAMDASARGIGVLIVFGHAVIPARGATKWHTSDNLAFATNGPEEPTRAEPLAPTALADVTVDIIAAYPGAPRTLVDAALEHGADGLVIEAMGAGNVGRELAIAVGEALDTGTPVVITTRVPRGDVHGSYGGAGGGATLLQKGAIGSHYFRAPQARMLLAVAIATGAHPATLF
ncbi:L-asparaginase precursor [Corynebacterium ciconiae DSM 44920]|uniref:asparaginase n=1 Tax=Corynebacterium ciconiae TaxID=227319 RepID=UPI000380165F|nr:asparaginase [Corynebacterium ciconiae]WKD60797.1 L-asparaginase precursor [Corynebacterium ciconiae DSM 44920]